MILNISHNMFSVYSPVSSILHPSLSHPSYPGFAITLCVSVSSYPMKSSLFCLASYGVGGYTYMGSTDQD